MTVAENMFVSMDYCLTLESGEEVDKSAEGQPLGFIAGVGQIIPGLEKALMGKNVGETATVTVEPEEGYGVVQEDLFQEIPRNQFPEDADLQPGMTFQAQGPQGSFMISIAKINDNDTVTVDMNHPLAGQRLIFDVKIVDVRQPTPEELAQLSGGGCGCGCGSSAEDCKPEESDSCGSGGCGCS